MAAHSSAAAAAFVVLLLSAAHTTHRGIRRNLLWLRMQGSTWR
jgi:hypothetical protein